MLKGLDRVWRAAEILAGSEAGVKDRIRLARAELSAALEHPNEWPREQLYVAISLDRLIRVRGDIDPLDAMDAQGAGLLAEDILSLAADVQIAFHEQWKKTPDAETIKVWDAPADA
jgi:hypothetical protein